MSATDAADGHYDGVREYLAGLPDDQYTVELSRSKIKVLIGGPLPPELSDSSWLLGELPSSLTQSLHQAGFGVSMVSFQSEEVILVLVRGLHRWPGLGVNSREFGKLSVDTRLHQLAIGYLESGKLLCTHLGNNPNELTWPRIAPALFCYRHALELFIKSCILHRESVANCDHNISGLLKQYLKLYPQDVFRFYREPDLPALEEMLGGQFADVREFERKPDQVYRYSADKQGQPPKAIYGGSPAACLSLLERLERDMARIWGASATWMVGPNHLLQLAGAARPAPAAERRTVTPHKIERPE